jgi:hypothetical protein
VVSYHSDGLISADIYFLFYAGKNTLAEFVVRTLRISWFTISTVLLSVDTRRAALHRLPQVDKLSVFEDITFGVRISVFIFADLHTRNTLLIKCPLLWDEWGLEQFCISAFGLGTRFTCFVFGFGCFSLARFWGVSLSWFGLFLLVVFITLLSSSVTRRDSSHTLYLKMSFHAFFRVAVAVPQLMDISHLADMLFHESSPITLLVPFSAEDFGCMLTKSHKEYAELRRARRGSLYGHFIARTTGYALLSQRTS